MQSGDNQAESDVCTGGPLSRRASAGPDEPAEHSKAGIAHRVSRSRGGPLKRRRRQDVPRPAASIQRILDFLRPSDRKPRKGSRGSKSQAFATRSHQRGRLAGPGTGRQKPTSRQNSPSNAKIMHWPAADGWRRPGALPRIACLGSEAGRQVPGTGCLGVARPAGAVSAQSKSEAARHPSPDMPAPAVAGAFRLC